VQISPSAAEICTGNETENDGRGRLISTSGSGFDREAASVDSASAQSSFGKIGPCSLHGWVSTIRQIFCAFLGPPLLATLVVGREWTELRQNDREKSSLL